MKQGLIKCYRVNVSVMLATILSISGCVSISSDNKKTELLFNTLSASAVRKLNDNKHCTYNNAERAQQCEEARRQQVEQINQSIKKHRQGGQ